VGVVGALSHIVELLRRELATFDDVPLNFARG